MSEKKDPSFRVAVKCVAGSALVLAVVAVFAFGPWAGVGVAAGGALATVNLIFFGRLVEAFLANKGNAAPWAVLGALKLLGLFAAAYIVLNTGFFSALSFAVGYVSLPLGITLSTLFRQPPEDEPAGSPDPAAAGEPGPPDPDKASPGGPSDGEGGVEDSPPVEDVVLPGASKPSA